MHFAATDSINKFTLSSLIMESFKTFKRTCLILHVHIYVFQIIPYRYFMFVIVLVVYGLNLTGRIRFAARLAILEYREVLNL